MGVHEITLHAAIRAHLDASGLSMRALSLGAGLGEKAVADILSRPGLRPARHTLDRLSAAMGVALPAPAAASRETYAELIARLEGPDDPTGRGPKLARRLRWFLRTTGWVAETREVDRTEAIAFFTTNRPATFGLKDASYSTYKCDVLAAIDGGNRRARGRDVRDIGGVHGELQRQVRGCEAIANDLRNLAGSFLVYSHDRGIAPAEITTEVLLEYHRHRLTTGVKDEATCRKHVKRVATLLAKLKDLPEFAPYNIAAPPHPFEDRRRKYGGAEADAAIAPLMAEFDGRVDPWVRGEVSNTGTTREEFVAELDARRTPRSGHAPASTRRNGKKRRKSRAERESQAMRSRGFLLDGERWGTNTLRTRRAFVAAAAKALLAEEGYLIASLDDLTDPDVVDDIADVLEEANEGEHASEYVATGVKALRKIARDLLCRPAADVERLTALIEEVDQGRTGIAPRNAAKLRQFDEDRGNGLAAMSNAMVSEINDEVLRRRMRAKSKGEPTVLAALADGELARRAMLVVAHDLMMARAPRAANLVGARLDWVRWQGDLATLVVPSVEVKGRCANDPDLAIPLGPGQSRFLRRYLEDLRPRALREGDGRNPYLLPSPGGPRWRPGQPYQSILRRLCREVHRRVGVRIHPHLYRHLVGWLWLREEPGRLSEISKILGHASIATTAEYYAEVDEELALKHWQEHLNDRRERAERGRKPSPGKRSRRRC
jgi:integrase/lambda repressor-like predicted transcriptional regulator